MQLMKTEITGDPLLTTRAVAEALSQVLLKMYTVSQKKTSPTFLAITRESIDGFL